jgi:hypothetical protein
MNKDEIVLASTTANGMREITQERANQAMQEQAIAFAEWADANYYRLGVTNQWSKTISMKNSITTAELYTLFNTNNTNNGE